PPQFSIWSYLDDQPIARFDSLTRRMEPLVPWMEEVEKEVGDPWDSGEGNPRPLSFTSTPPGSPSGPHTWQAVLGCELREDRSTGGFFHYGYDGRDFISFDKETLTWVAAQPKAWKFKKEWEEDPGWSERNKFFLEETCIEWLQRYLSYKNRTQETTGEKDPRSLEILTCQAFGFYPKEIQATWRRDGEIWEQETLLRNMAPNSDGTYYLWLSIEIDPKERDRFRCHLEHEGLQEPGFALQGGKRKEEGTVQLLFHFLQNSIYSCPLGGKLFGLNAPPSEEQISAAQESKENSLKCSGKSWKTHNAVSEEDLFATWQREALMEGEVHGGRT
uniref:Ig-like domain-containing protein n=1 Tax=Pseudonaja textilis TaxID=8673 RepID=A0A670Z6D4_PSETE